ACGSARNFSSHDCDWASVVAVAGVRAIAKVALLIWRVLFLLSWARRRCYRRPSAGGMLLALSWIRGGLVVGTEVSRGPSGLIGERDASAPRFTGSRDVARSADGAIPRRSPC